jgi:hypothetical protein
MDKIRPVKRRFLTLNSDVSVYWRGQNISACPLPFIVETEKELLKGGPTTRPAEAKTNRAGEG